MEHTREYNHLIDTQEQDMENNEIKQDEFYEETNYELITVEEIKYIHQDLDQGIMSICHNDTENIIDDTEDYFQCHS